MSGRESGRAKGDKKKQAYTMHGGLTVHNIYCVADSLPVLYRRTLSVAVVGSVTLAMSEQAIGHVKQEQPNLARVPGLCRVVDVIKVQGRLPPIQHCSREGRSKSWGH